MPKKEVVESLTKLQDEFATLLVNVKRLQEKFKIDIAEVKFMYNTRFDTTEFDENCKSFQDVLLLLSTCNFISTFNVHPLELLMKVTNTRLGNEMKQIVKTYIEKKDKFLNSVVVADFICVVQPKLNDSNNMIEVIIKIPKDSANKRTLKDIETLGREAFEGYFDMFVHMRVIVGSVCIIWLFHKHLTVELKHSVRTAPLIKEGVEEASIDGDIVLKQVKGKTIDAMVTIGNETFNILEIPNKQSILVEVHVDLLLTGLDFHPLVTNLDILNQFTLIACNRVAGSDLQIKFRRIGVEMTRLCDNSARILLEFKQTTQDILVDLKVAYLYFIDGFEDLAIFTLQKTATMRAQSMADKAENLTRAFNDKAEEVLDILSDTFRIFEKKGQKRLEDKEKQHLRERDSEEKATPELAAKKDNFIVNALQFLSKCPTRGKQYLSTKQETDALEKERSLEERKIYVKEMAEYIKKIRNCEEDSDLAEAVVISLQNISRVLKTMSSMMKRICIVWNKLLLECTQLNSQDVQEMIASTKKLPMEERLDVWGSQSFKISGVHFYAQWLALDKICDTYLEKIKRTQGGLQKTLETDHEEAEKKFQDLADTLLMVLEKAIENESIRVS